MYDTSLSGEIVIDFLRDGWVTPHLVQLGTENNRGERNIRTLEVIPLTGQVHIYSDERDWDDLAL